MSYENVIEKTKKIESILSDMGAEGKGLNEKLNSIEHKFDEKLKKAIRFIATIRNKLIHENDFKMDDKLEKAFNETYDFIMDYIKRNNLNYQDENPWFHSSSNSYDSSNSSDGNSDYQRKSSSSDSYGSSNNTDDLFGYWNNLSGWQRVGVGVVAVGVAALFALSSI